MLTRSIAKLRLCSPGAAPFPTSGAPPPSTAPLLLLPKEMLHHLLSFLPLSSWGQLCLTSRPVREAVVAWVLSPACLALLTAHLATTEDREQRLQWWVAVCRQFGVFAKRATMLETSGARLASLFAWQGRLAVRGVAGLTGPWAEVTSRAGAAAALHTFALGWQDTELANILQLLVERFPVLRRLDDPSFAGTQAMAAAQNAAKSEFRAVLRTFFWEFQADDASQAAWLAFLLRRFAESGARRQRGSFSVRGLQSILLFFLLGSTCASRHLDHQQATLCRLGRTPDYTLMQEPFLTASYAEAKRIFGELGAALRLLESHRDTAELGLPLYGLMMALFSGSSWHRDNTAAALLFSSEAVVTLFVTGLARDGKDAMANVAELVVALLVVCENLGNSLNQGLANIVDYTFQQLPRTEEQRRRLMAEFWREMDGRMEEGAGLRMLAQLGLHLGKMAYQGMGAGGQPRTKRLEARMEVEE